VVTEIELCIRCCACIKNCPTGAKVMEDSMIRNMANLLSQYFRYPKEPRIFGVDV
jgi:ferredoxin